MVCHRPHDPSRLALDAARLVDLHQIARVEGIVHSMTVHERTRPELIDGSRKRRMLRRAMNFACGFTDTTEAVSGESGRRTDSASGHAASGSDSSVG